MKEDFFCYITYAVPSSMIPALPFAPTFIGDTSLKEEEGADLNAQSTLYPPGFMPGWFLGGSFPEDDFED